MNVLASWYRERDTGGGQSVLVSTRAVLGLWFICEVFVNKLLTRLTEGILSEGKQGFEPKEPKEEAGSNQQGRRQQSPQSKLNSKKGLFSHIRYMNMIVQSTAHRSVTNSEDARVSS